MLPLLPQEFILKDKIKLYDNIAKFNGYTGRLFAELQVYPSPNIRWEFEVLGEDQEGLSIEFESGVVDPLLGTWFSINSPIVSSHSRTVGLCTAISGIALKAIYHDIETACHTFQFFLPNARFQFESLAGQKFLEQKVFPIRQDKEIESGDAGRTISVLLDQDLELYLEIRKASLEWLDPKEQNTGTRITTLGKISHRNLDETKPENVAEWPTLTLKSVVDLFDTLNLLLAFANGGYLGPLCVKGFDLAHFERSPAAVLIYRTTPLEQLGMTWLARDSSLGIYLQCFSALQRMLQRAPWDETLPLILAWYFQAIQPSDGQGLGKEWPIVANAAGTALERLSYTVLVLEENDAAKRSDHELLFDIRKVNVAKGHWNLGDSPTQENFSVTQKRLHLLLERIGLTQLRGYDEADDVRAFFNLRNEATHPKPGLAVAIPERRRLLNKSIQWIEEVILWRLGYSGRHLDRSQVQRASRDPRYDLSTRDPN